MDEAYDLLDLIAIEVYRQIPHCKVSIEINRRQMECNITTEMYYMGRPILYIKRFTLEFLEAQRQYLPDIAKDSSVYILNSLREQMRYAHSLISGDFWNG